MLKHTKLLTLVTISFLISASGAHAFYSTPSTFDWPSGWEKTMKQMPAKSAKPQYNLAAKVRALKLNRAKAKKK